MLSKKYLGGFSCASCDKHLESLNALKEKFAPWSNMPKRERFTLGADCIGYSRIGEGLKSAGAKRAEHVSLMVQSQELNNAAGMEEDVQPKSKTQRNKSPKAVLVRKL